MPLTRRDFIARTAATAASLTLTERLQAMRLTEPLLPVAGGAVTPRIISSSNGLRGVARAWEMMQRGDDTLDAIIAGVNIQELDPDDDSVGLGGLPNEEGVVQLDASCMHGPTRRAGAVGCIEEIATPSLVAKAIMDYTDHIMLVGHDAKRFALEMGFKAQNLLTERSRQNWLRRRARLNPRDFRLDFDDDVVIRDTHGTINMNCVNAKGEMSSVTTTSGMAYKVPGRVGDSPIIGAGQYCDQSAGAAGSTGYQYIGWAALVGFTAQIAACAGMAVLLFNPGAFVVYQHKHPFVVKLLSPARQAATLSIGSDNSMPFMSANASA